MGSRSTQEPGVPLGHYRQHGADIELSCTMCVGVRVVSLERAIAGLERRGLGGAETGIKAFGRLLRQPCERCGAAAWDARPRMPPPRNPGIPEHGRVAPGRQDGNNGG